LQGLVQLSLPRCRFPDEH